MLSQYPITFSKKHFKVMFSFQAKFFDQEIAKLTCRTNWTKFIDFGTFRGTFNKAPAIENNIQRWSKKLINTRSVKNPNTSRPLDQHYQKNSLKHKTDLNTRAGFATFTLPFGFTLVFYEATFQIDGRVKRHNVQIWGAQHPHQISKMKEIHQKSTWTE